MYDYAKAYAEAIGASSGKLPDLAGELCSLCQERLSEKGAARIKSFNDFIASEATRAADAARDASDVAIETLRTLSIPTKVQGNLALADFAGLNDTRKALVDEITDYCEAAIQRRGDLVKAATKEDFTAVPALKASVAEKIAAHAALLENEAKAHDEAAKDDGARASERAQLAQLRDRKKLAD